MPLRLRERSLAFRASSDTFASCHAATLLALPEGRLLLACFAGSGEGKDDSAIWLALRGPGGWETPRRLFAEAGLPHWNPVLHADGVRLLLFYKVGADVQRWTTRVSESQDGGESWSAPRPLVAGDARPRGPVKNKLLALENGDWLAPNSVEAATAWDASVDISTDRGAHWQLAPVPLAHPAATAPPADTASRWPGLAAQQLWENDPARVFSWDGVIQPSLWQSGPERVHMLLRSTRGTIYRSDSADAGRHWCAAYATDLPNNNSGHDLVRADGALVLACNPVRGNWGRRTPLALLASADNGASWPERFVVKDGEGEFSYPAIVTDGTSLHLAYTIDRRAIAYAHFELAPWAP